MIKSFTFGFMLMTAFHFGGMDKEYHLRGAVELAFLQGEQAIIIEALK